MKIAVVWFYGSPLGHCSFRFEEYVRGLTELGYEATVVCPRSSDDGFDVPKTLAESSREMLSVDFWRRVGAAAAIVVTFHQMSELLAAIRGAGTRVIAMGDSDGRMGVRAYPVATFERLAFFETRYPRTTQLKLALGFFKRWLRAHWKTDPQDAEYLASTRLSDVVVLGCEEATRHFRRFLELHGAAGEGRKLFASPFAIRRLFLEWPELPPKRRELVVVGRYDTPMKNAPLMLRTLDRVMRSEWAPERVRIFEAGGTETLRPLARRFDGVVWSEPRDPQYLAEAHGRARSFLFSSLWEGSPPHSGWEALCMGASVIVTPVPALRSWPRQGPFGTVARARRPAALAEAVRREMRAWDDGERDAEQIAGYWRRRADGVAVIRGMMAALEERVGGLRPQA